MPFLAPGLFKTTQTMTYDEGKSCTLSMSVWNTKGGAGDIQKTSLGNDDLVTEDSEGKELGETGKEDVLGWEHGYDEDHEGSDECAFMKPGYI